MANIKKNAEHKTAEKMPFPVINSVNIPTSG